MSIQLESRAVLRNLWRNSGGSLLAILTLAIGVGATTVGLSVIQGVLLKPLPFDAADRLVSIVQLVPGPSAPLRGGLAIGQVVALRQQSGQRVLDAVGLYRPQTGALATAHGLRRLTGAQVSTAVLSRLQPPPVAGRLLAESDEEPAAAPVVVVSSRVWNELFLADPNITERTLLIEAVPHRIVGVMPDGYRFPHVPGGFRNTSGQLDDSPEFWAPFPVLQNSAQSFSLFPALGVLTPGTTAERASLALDSSLPPLPAGSRLGVEVVGVVDELTRNARSYLFQIQIAAFLVLLVACVNLTNLLLVRTAARQQEISLRVALGANRRHVIAYSLIEGLALSILAGLLGLLIAANVLLLVRSTAPITIPNLRFVHIDFLTGAVAMGLAVTAGLSATAFVLARTLSSKGANLSRGVGRAALNAAARRSSSLLVVGQVALAVLTVSSAAGLVATFVNLVRLDPGFEASQLLSFRMSLPNERYPSPAALQQVHSILREELLRSPGVTHAAVAGPQHVRSGIAIEGVAEVPNSLTIRLVGPGYFDTIRPSYFVGRSPDLSGAAAGAVVVNRTLATLAGEDAIIGRHLTIGDWPPLEIVGVVSNLSFGRADGEPIPEAFVSISAERAPAVPAWLVRTSGRPEDVGSLVSSTVRRIDPELAIFDVSTADQVRDDSVADSRFYAGASAVFAIAALALASLGLYGLLSYVVRLRTAEFGVRLALGATPLSIGALVFRHAVVLALCGVAIGWAFSGLSVRLFQALTPGVEGPSWALLAASAFVLLVSSALASIGPASVALRMTPSEILRR